MKQTRGHSDELREQRLVKLLLPVHVIRSMDELLVEGTGGFSTRNEFVTEAVESYLLELRHELAPDEPSASGRPRRLHPVGGSATATSRPTEESAAATERSLAKTGLPAVSQKIGPHFVGEAEVVSEPLFGMHNRDYPSLWAAMRLAEYLAQGRPTVDEFAERVVREAWTFADSLRGLEAFSSSKLTALFPTNQEKWQAASDAFVNFAIGSATPTEDGVHAEGPLFLWRLIDVARSGNRLELGLRPEGWDLLSRLEGLTIEQPHPEGAARTFLSHLSEHAQPDYWGFELVLRVVAEGSTRTDLLGAFGSARPDWRESVAATNAQGYVARCREWGLVEPKVIEGRYRLTEFGGHVLRGGPVE